MQHIPILILAGGFGTRISEETQLKPKPMIEIGGAPILVHIMRYYYAHGFNDFVICAGYRSWEIKDYFLHYQYRQNHVYIDHRDLPLEEPKAIGSEMERWRVRVLETGHDCMTGGRIARALDFLTEAKEDFANFGVTYGDGLANVNLAKELEFHQNHQKMGTVLGVPSLARFGELRSDATGKVSKFDEKPASRDPAISGGFFFFKKEFRNYLNNESSCILEKEPLSKLSLDGELMVYPHADFWHPMDTLRDKNYLQELWDSGKAPWLETHRQIEVEKR
jgi:glucose-1-phosphate cytidylyltransferase